MSTNLSTIKGSIRFPIKGQDARPSWMQKALRAALDNGEGAPNELRYQCRIAQDARTVFEEIKVPGGTVTLHHKIKPQFGRNQQGQPFLTVTLIDSRDGESYKVRWVGDAVPSKMQEVAVKHDEGRRVGRTVVALRWDNAEITPARRMIGRFPEVTAEDLAEKPAAPRRKRETKPRAYDRICRADLTA